MTRTHRRIAIFALIILTASFATLCAIDAPMMHEAKDRPELVLITAKTKSPEKISIASGVLVHPRVVLTAAHVVDVGEVFDVTLPYAKGGPLASRTTIAKRYPSYERGDADGDLAVLILPESLEIGAKLPTMHMGKLLRLDQKMQVVGRVNRGKPESAKLFETTTEIVPFPGRINLYGGFPRRVEPGDSGGPVYDATAPQTLIGVISGYQPWNRRAVAVDAIMPLSKKATAWVTAQFPDETTPKAKP